MSVSSRAKDKKPQVNNNLDYQLERLHLYGEQHPNSGLKVKVEGYQFAMKIPITDPITRKTTQEPLKPFMVNALSKAFEDGRMILSPFDDVLHKQLVDYVVERITPSGVPVYTSKDEHFVDALGLAYLAMVLKFPSITKFIEETKPHEVMIKEVSAIKTVFGAGERTIRNIESVKDAWGNKVVKQIGKEPGERRGDYQKWVKVPLNSHTVNSNSRSFSRSSRNTGFSGRTLW